MYANYYNQPTSPSSLSNNPFIEDPTSAHARFPDINASSGYPNHPQQYPPQYNPAYASGGPYQTQPQTMPAQNQFPSTSYTSQYPTQPHMSIGPQPTGIGAFQSTSGYPQQQQQQQQQQQYPVQPNYPMTYAGTGYPQTMQMQTTATPGYLSEFDPFSQQQQQIRNQNQNQTQTQTQQIGPASDGAPQGVSHPRDVIRTHKSGLEAWDTYSWKQLFGACNALKEAWSARKQQAESVVRQYGGLSDPGLFGSDPAFGYSSQVEGWKQVFKDANDRFDTVVASTFQLHEVFNSYRQSGDAASKRRVRESCNAAVKGLPDWPSN